MARDPKAGALPQRWPWLIRGFQRYARRYVRKHFHAVRLSKSGAALPAAGEPLLVVLNHPSWWDPMICMVLSPSFDREHFAAIDAVAIQRYRFFAKLGFVGVDTKSLRGAADCLRVQRVEVARQRRFNERGPLLAVQTGVVGHAQRLADSHQRLRCALRPEGVLERDGHHDSAFEARGEVADPGL